MKASLLMEGLNSDWTNLWHSLRLWTQGGGRERISKTVLKSRRSFDAVYCREKCVFSKEGN